MRSVQKVGTVIRAYFEVFDATQAPVVGLINTDFTKLLLGDGVDDPTTVVTVSGVGSGRYEAAFTSGTTGVRHLVVRHATYGKKGWHETFDVTTDGVLTANQIADALLDRATAVESFTVREAFKLIAAMLAGTMSGTGIHADPYVFNGIGTATTRVTMEADSGGQRPVVTLSP